MLCAVALTACSDESPVRPSRIERQVVLAPGQTAFIAEASIAVRFLQVNGDSRCPSSVMCVWAGDALVQIEAQSSGAARSYDLHTYDRPTVVHGAVAITLVELAPYPVTRGSIPAGDYRATLSVTR
jgi:hypothetical protein